jgi:hypothetical protein
MFLFRIEKSMSGITIRNLTVDEQRSLYLALRTKKRPLHLEGAEDPSSVSSPQDQTARSQPEKGFTESPEIQETEIVLPKRITI